MKVSETRLYRWYELINDISKKSAVQINRYVLTNVHQEDITLIELHRYADASRIAHGGVVYLIFTQKGSANRQTQLIASKSK